MSYDEIKKMRAKGANLDEIKKALEDDKMDGDMVAKHLKQLKDDEAADELRKKKDEARKETASIAALAEQMSAQAEQFAALEKQLVESEQQRTKLAEAFGAERQLRRTVEFVEAAEQFSAIPAKREELGKHLMWLYDSDPSDKKEHFTYFEGLLGRVNKVIGAGEVFSVVGDGRPGSGENEDQFLAAVEKIRVDKYADKTYAVGFAEAFKVAETSQPALARQYANSTYHKREKE